jgi:hypothetical protein
VGVLGASQLVDFPKVKFYLSLKRVEGVFVRPVGTVQYNQLREPRYRGEDEITNRVTGVPSILRYSGLGGGAITAQVALGGLQGAWNSLESGAVDGGGEKRVVLFTWVVLRFIRKLWRELSSFRFWRNLLDRCQKGSVI